MTSEAINLTNVSLTTEGKSILRDINISVQPGQCCAIIGPNGAGKSSLIAIMTGYLWPSNGSVTILGQSFGQVEIAQVREKIGLIAPSRVPEFESWLPVRTVVATGLFGTIVLPEYKSMTPADWKKVDAEIAALHLQDKAMQPIGKLSTGEQMRTLIARAMVSQPHLIILDEPTAGLDMGARVGIIRALEKLRTRPHPPTLLVVSHHLDELPYPIDQIILLKNGSIITQGSPAETLTSERLSQTFDCPVELTRIDGRFYARARHEEWKI
jgi:iron complex transport system ATP-binding protein